MVGGYEIGLWTLLVLASITDLIWGKIFNWMIVVFLVGGLTSRGLSSGWSGLGESALAVAIAFALFYPLYLIRAMAAGDVKLLMAVGAWSSSRLVIEMGVVAILIGAVAGLVFLLRKEGFRGSWKSVSAHLKPKGELRGNRMPFAPAFLCAYLFLQIAEKYRWTVIG